MVTTAVVPTLNVVDAEAIESMAFAAEAGWVGRAKTTKTSRSTARAAQREIRATCLSNGRLWFRYPMVGFNPVCQLLAVGGVNSD